MPSEQRPKRPLIARVFDVGFARTWRGDGAPSRTLRQRAVSGTAWREDVDVDASSTSASSSHRPIELARASAPECVAVHAPYFDDHR